ncbi:MAG: Gfo/Idh/MocA family oxidoreductase [Planctomycetes bacterium]|nr:Gfo/Idh/MocA family oxidoreductase [Planctomycetota bacterium]
MKKIKVGQIGIGHNHAHEKMCAFRKLPDTFEVVGIVEESPEWREKRGDLPGYKNLPWLTEEELLGMDDVQAISVEPDVPDLNAVALRCLKTGKHIHMDKPAGETIAGFKAVLDEAGARNLTVQLGYMFRGNPAIQFCLKAVREGWLGRIFEIDAVMSRMDGQPYRDWLSKYHGGAFYIFGGHLIDLVLLMMGRPDNIVPFLKKTRPETDSLFDNGMAVLEYEYATAVVRTTVVEVNGFLRRQMTVCGDEGTIEINPIEPFNQPHKCLPKLRMTLAKEREGYKAGAQEVVFDQMHDRYTDQLTELAAVIRGAKENPYSLEHELLLQECLLRACGYPENAFL